MTTLATPTTPAPAAGFMPPPLPLTEKHLVGMSNLIGNSHRNPMDLGSVLPWERGVDKQQLPKKSEHSWIYGTPHFGSLDAAQLHELLWLENARDVSMFINLEQTLPPLYMGYINHFSGQLTPEVYEYLMIFSKEEIVHTMMFKRYMQLAGLPQFAPADGLFELLTQQLPAMAPVAGVIVTLLLEWTAELAAMHVSQHEGLEPLTREMFYQHHVDESRHIAFGRWIAESFFEKADPDAAARMRELIKGVMARLVPQFSYNPEIATHTSFRFPIAVDDVEEIRAIQNSATNQALNEKRFAPQFAWLRKLGAM